MPNNNTNINNNPDDSCCGCGGCCAGCAILAVGYWIGSHYHVGVDIHSRTSDSARSKESALVAKSEEFKTVKDLLLTKIEFYQREISPLLQEANSGKQICKFEPSCSEYAKQAIKKHGAAKGTAMAAYRLARCNPLSEGGSDPIV